MSAPSRINVHAVGATTCAALALAGWFLLLRPMANARNAYAGLIADLQSQRQTLDAQRAAELAGRSAAKVAGDSLAAHPLLLQPATAVNTRLQAITELATARNLRIDTIEAGRPDAFERYAVIPIQLSGRCRFQDLAAFLADLRQQMPDIDLSSTDLSGRFTEGSLGQSLIMKLRWHTALAEGAQ